MELKKDLSLLEVFCITSGAMMSSGLFILPGIAYGMAEDEMDSLEDDELRDMISDEVLADFALGKGGDPEPEELDSILLRIQKWE